MNVNDEYLKQLKCEGGPSVFLATRVVVLFKSRSRPLEQHDRTVAKTNLHLNVLITNPISDLIFKTMKFYLP